MITSVQTRNTVDLTSQLIFPDVKPLEVGELAQTRRNLACRAIESQLSHRQQNGRGRGNINSNQHIDKDHNVVKYSEQNVRRHKYAGQPTRPGLLTTQLISIKVKLGEVGELAQTRRNLACDTSPRGYQPELQRRRKIYK